MKVKMKSGEKELEFDHLAIYTLTEETGREIFDLLEDIDKDDDKDIKLTTFYKMMFAAMQEQYKDIKEMLKDFKAGEFNNYIKILGESVGKHLGAGTTAE